MPLVYIYIYMYIYGRFSFDAVVEFFHIGPRCQRQARPPNLNPGQPEPFTASTGLTHKLRGPAADGIHTEGSRFPFRSRVLATPLRFKGIRAECHF